jgi:hypothetical protein
MQNQHRTTPSISLKHDQRQTLETWAGKEGMSLGAYIKKVALGEIPQKNRYRNGSSITAKDFIDLYREVNSIGVNLNQLTHRINIVTTKRKANGDMDIDLFRYKIEDIRRMIDLFETVDKHLSEMKALIQEAL